MDKILRYISMNVDLEGEVWRQDSLSTEINKDKYKGDINGEEKDNTFSFFLSLFLFFP